MKSLEFLGRQQVNESLCNWIVNAKNNLESISIQNYT